MILLILAAALALFVLGSYKTWQQRRNRNVATAYLRRR
ncbi:response regulator [Pantoea allii]|uniref:Response regulator n=1 Tax=Pantoea allii TaxID=574096 RepID=A0ABS6VE53_9GAMM|nr:response regulator [Pantoea allii]MBW1214209.1 response regulator [Pantoea allii]MBW1252530.1 response regulator [Pantoea allii]MBW1257491.1 response regulator [Pantoea allii]MBW1261877.1 response regulator [Pantoea allii]MBW1268641.1 response regulator [Pantoea allii]